MPYVETPLSKMVRNEPAKAKRRILAVLRENGVHYEKAAKSLECNYTTFWRWLEKLDMKEAVEKLRLRAIVEGWHHGGKGGRPLGSLGAKGRAKKAAGNQSTAKP